jgi:hypothetical protein
VFARVVPITYFIFVTFRYTMAHVCAQMLRCVGVCTAFRLRIHNTYVHVCCVVLGCALCCVQVYIIHMCIRAVSCWVCTVSRSGIHNTYVHVCCVVLGVRCVLFGYTWYGCRVD